VFVKIVKIAKFWGPSLVDLRRLQELCPRLPQCYQHVLLKNNNKMSIMISKNEPIVYFSALSLYDCALYFSWSGEGPAVWPADHCNSRTMFKVREELRTKNAREILVGEILGPDGMRIKID